MMGICGYSHGRVLQYLRYLISHSEHSRNVLTLNVKIIYYSLVCTTTWGMLRIISGLQQDYLLLSTDAILSWCCKTVSVPPVGILYGTMTLELGGKVTIECEKTKCFSELEFKLKVPKQSALVAALR